MNNQRIASELVRISKDLVISSEVEDMFDSFLKEVKLKYPKVWTNPKFIKSFNQMISVVKQTVKFPVLEGAIVSFKGRETVMVTRVTPSEVDVSSFGNRPFSYSASTECFFNGTIQPMKRMPSNIVEKIRDKYSHYRDPENVRKSKLKPYLAKW